MSLAIFDLDNTLLAGDSDYLWGQFLVKEGIVDGEHYEAENLRFYEEYKAGGLDIYAFLRFSLRPLAEHDPAQLRAWREVFIERYIIPRIAPGTPALLERHRRQGDTLMIITATNHFVTAPIAALLGIEHLLATEPEFRNGRYTGEVSGIPCFQEGKVTRLQAWLDEHGMGLDGSWFYSDSHNDLPLLETVSHPVAVDPDDTLREWALTHQWPVISLREPDTVPQPT
ncbi:MAG TPA: HAD family hydrolase [Gammaproteobacteria bacterium]|nr:HAD family hydrolase [Gammaproteobacteria bacterium]